MSRVDHLVPLGWGEPGVHFFHGVWRPYHPAILIPSFVYQHEDTTDPLASTP